jgi:hypothetical protein
MKVKELINKLTEFNMDSEVRLGDIKHMKGDTEATESEFFDNDIVQKLEKVNSQPIFISTEEIRNIVKSVAKK